MLDSFQHLQEILRLEQQQELLQKEQEKQKEKAQAAGSRSHSGHQKGLQGRTTGTPCRKTNPKNVPTTLVGGRNFDRKVLEFIPTAFVVVLCMPCYVMAIAAVRTDRYYCCCCCGCYHWGIRTHTNTITLPSSARDDEGSRGIHRHIVQYSSARHAFTILQQQQLLRLPPIERITKTSSTLKPAYNTYILIPLLQIE